MSIGCLIGYIYATKNEKVILLQNRIIAYLSIFLSFILWFFHFELKYFNDEFYSLLFGIMILNIATNKNLKINFDIKIGTFLGKISYGIYMYHWIVLLLVLRFVRFNEFQNSIIYNLILYSSVLGFTIIVSWFSFNTFEKFFLNKKKYLENIDLRKNKLKN